MSIGIKQLTGSGELNHRILEDLEGELGSSFYIFDINKLRENYKKMNTAFKSRYENFIIGYSYKTNYLPILCKELSRLGAYAEVVSRLEYELALKIGVAPSKIIYNGPLKTRDDIFTALRNESMINIDSMYEITYVKEFARLNPSKIVKIGVRVNFDTVSSLQDDYEISRFGICTENGNFESALKQLKEDENIRVIGLHGHFSTKNRSVESYRYKTEKLCRLAKTYIKHDLEFIDIGGGIYGEIPKSFRMNTPTFDDYAESICEVMKNEFIEWIHKPLLILEPGVSMVANVFSFAAKVFEVKTIGDQTFIVVDGSIHNVKPTMHKNNPAFRKISCRERKQKIGAYHIVGYTCMEKDYIAKEITSELPQIGDYILFENVGAYTIVFNPPFIKERPGIVAVEDKKFTVARKREKFEQFFNEDIYTF